MFENLYFSRRLLIVSAILPALGALLVMGLPQAAMVAGAAFLLAALILTLLPAAVLDTVALALTAAAAIPGWTLIAGMTIEDAPMKWGIFIVVFGTIFLWLGTVVALTWFNNLHAGTIQMRSRSVVDIGVEDAISVLVLRPGEVQHGRRASSVGEDGFYNVTFGVEGVSLVDFTPEDQEHSYKQRIVEEENLPSGGVRLVIQSVVDLEEVARSSMLEMIFEPKGAKTLVTSHEVHDFFSWFAAASFWLEDAGARDTARRVEAFKAGEAGFTSYANQRTLMTVIANLFIRVGLSERNEP